MFVSNTRRTAAPFQPRSGDFGGNLVNVEDVCAHPVKPIDSGKQIVNAPLSYLAFQKRNQVIRGEETGLIGFGSQFARQS